MSRPDSRKAELRDLHGKCEAALDDVSHCSGSVNVAITSHANSNAIKQLRETLEKKLKAAKVVVADVMRVDGLYVAAANDTLKKTTRFHEERYGFLEKSAQTTITRALDAEKTSAAPLPAAASRPPNKPSVKSTSRRIPFPEAAEYAAASLGNLQEEQEPVAAAPSSIATKKIPVPPPQKPTSTTPRPQPAQTATDFQKICDDQKAELEKTLDTITQKLRQQITASFSAEVKFSELAELREFASGQRSALDESLKKIGKNFDGETELAARYRLLRVEVKLERSLFVLNACFNEEGEYESAAAADIKKHFNATKTFREQLIEMANGEAKREALRDYYDHVSREITQRLVTEDVLTAEDVNIPPQIQSQLDALAATARQPARIQSPTPPPQSLSPPSQPVATTTNTAANAHPTPPIHSPLIPGIDDDAVDDDKRTGLLQRIFLSPPTIPGMPQQPNPFAEMIENIAGADSKLVLKSIEFDADKEAHAFIFEKTITDPAVIAAPRTEPIVALRNKSADGNSIEWRTNLAWKENCALIAVMQKQLHEKNAPAMQTATPPQDPTAIRLGTLVRQANPQTIRLPGAANPHNRVEGVLATNLTAAEHQLIDAFFNAGFQTVHYKVPGESEESVITKARWGTLNNKPASAVSTSSPASVVQASTSVARPIASAAQTSAQQCKEVTRATVNSVREHDFEDVRGVFIPHTVSFQDNSAQNQAKEILDNAKILVDKGYEKVATTYSANQDEMKKINDHYTSPATKPFPNCGTNQGNVINALRNLLNTDPNYTELKSKFFVIPIPTMLGGGASGNADDDAVTESLQHAEQFLNTGGALLGWRNQESDDKNETVAIGGGIANSFSGDAKRTYLVQAKTIQEKFLALETAFPYKPAQLTPRR